jgi:hypothetical protein
MVKHVKQAGALDDQGAVAVDLEEAFGKLPPAPDRRFRVQQAGAAAELCVATF